MLFTAGLFFATRSAARRQDEALRREHTLVHRPRLHVRNVVLKPAEFKYGQLVGGQFYVSNVGGTAAKVTDSHCEIRWMHGLPQERPYEGKDGNLAVPRGVVEPGTSIVGQFQSGTPWPQQTGPCSVQHGLKVFVMGWIAYSDNIGIQRRTAFCRELIPKPEAERFYPVEDGDYEHEE